MKTQRLLSIITLVVACTPTSKVSCKPPSDRVKIFAQAQLKPEVKEGAPFGIRVDNILHASFLACLGLRNGDRVVEFNGKRLRDAFDVSGFLTEFGVARSFSLVVEDASGGTRRIINE